jgi:hypothetical protein
MLKWPIFKPCLSLLLQLLYRLAVMDAEFDLAVSAKPA